MEKEITIKLIYNEDSGEARTETQTDLSDLETMGMMQVLKELLKETN